MSTQSKKDIVVPPMGESVTEATVSRWLKQQGEAVALDEPLAELETEKVTLEISSPAHGTLTEQFVPEGAIVNVGTVIGRVTEGEGQPPPPKKESPQAEPPQAEEKTEKSSSEETSLSPAVRKLVEENQLDPRRIEGHGKEGRITKTDVLTLLDKSEVEKESPEVPRVKESRVERVHMSRLRQKIAERLKEAQNTAAILTTFNEVDMTEVMSLRSQLKEFFEKKHGVKLGLMSFFVKSCLVGLKEIPTVNAEIEGDELIYKNYYDISVAVGTPQGLVVPVVRDANKKSFAQIEKDIADLSQKAREGKLSMKELQGGTFTISNGGVYGSLMSTPILNPPQSGILGMHKIQERPMAVDGKVEIRPMMYLALSYDHRIIDGKEAVTFLVRVKECIENPERILLDL